MTDHNRELLHYSTIRAVELISVRLGRGSSTFYPAHKGVGCSFWWDVKACPIFLEAMREKDDSPRWKGDMVDCLFCLSECCEHGLPKLHVDVDQIHKDELPAVYAIMGQLGHIGITVITAEDDDEDDEDIQVAGAA